MPDYGPVLSKTYPLCFGGNIFGWTIDREDSFTVLDAYADAGGNFIDTADVYAAWVEGNIGGESETIIGEWMTKRGNRDRMVIATKVGQVAGVGADAVRTAAEQSLARLRTDHIDLYYTHIDDPSTPLEETLGALNELVQSGKVLELGASGYTADRLAQALSTSEREGFARYRALQPHYNLLERSDYEGALQDLCAREEIACIPFFGLARGFLTGKYRPGQEVETERGDFAWNGEWDDRAHAVLAALDEIASRQATTAAAVALAWLRDQPTVHTPIASARTVEQLRELLPMAELTLDAAEIARLADAAAVSTAE
jgi:aryl-alcohol dehydrogenase (NADP+)